MTRKPFFSIVTVTYNSANTLELCFQSLFKQEFKDWELIVVDGKSSDGTLEIIKKHRSKIAKFVSEEDAGIYDAMNKGAKLAQGKHLYFLNSDDRFFDKKALLDIHSAILGADSDLVTAAVEKTYPSFKVIKNNRLSSQNLKTGIMPPHQGMFVSRALFKRLKGFKLDYQSSGDFDFACRLFQIDPRYLYLDRVVAKFGAGGMSANKKISYRETASIIENYFGRFYGARYYFKKIILEQNFKKLLTVLGCQDLINLLTRKIMQRNGGR